MTFNYKPRTAFPEDIREYVAYDPATGDFRWRKPPHPKFRAGDKAGTVSPNGYVKVKFRRFQYFAQRLAWFLQTGEQPPAVGMQVDHIDGNRANNKWENLRLVTHSQNQANRAFGPMRGLKKNSAGRWHAQIGHHNRLIYIGSFDTPEAARAAFDAKARELYGEHAGVSR